MNDDLAQTDRSRLRRFHELGSHERATIHAILDAEPNCTVAYVMDGAPYLTPTLQWRLGERVYWHGSSASRAIRAGKGAEVCLNVTIVDGLVVARSGFNHSVNARSVTLFGTAELVPDDQKEALMTAFIKGLWPGRTKVLRPMLPQELKATTLLSMPITEGSAKVRRRTSQRITLCRSGRGSSRFTEQFRRRWRMRATCLRSRCPRMSAPTVGRMPRRKPNFRSPYVGGSGRPSRPGSDPSVHP